MTRVLPFVIPEPKRTLFRGHQDKVVSVVFSPNDKHVASTSLDGTARIWEVETGNEIRYFDEHNGYPISSTFSPDGKLIVLIYDTGITLIWNNETGIVERLLECNSARSCAFSPDGKFLAIGLMSGEVDVYTLRGNDITRWKHVHKHDQEVDSLSFSLDGKRLVSGSEDRTVGIYNVGSDIELKWVAKSECFVKTPTFSPDGKYVAFGSEHDTHITILDAETGSTVRRIHCGILHVYPVRFSSNGQWLIYVGQGYLLTFMETRTEKQIKKIPFLENVWSFDISGNDAKLAINTCNDHQVRDVNTFGILDFGGPNLGAMSPEEAELFI